jgi:hypothetical protein
MSKEYIEREALIARYDAEHVGPPGRARDLMATAPAADVAPVVHGRKIEDEGIGVFYLCSLCGECLPYGANYCPNCGAKMDKEETNELD